MIAHNLEAALRERDQLLTVILIIRDRPQYTFRWMDFANRAHFPFSVLIADGGKDTSVEIRLKNKTHYPNLQYTYLRYSYDQTTKEYLSKVANALTIVNTPYVVLADDDDFWNVDGLRAAIDFLENHLEYATCRGTNFIFIKNKNHVENTAFSPSTGTSVEQSLPSERVFSMTKKFSSTYGDVHRSKQLAENFEKIANINIHFLPMMDMMLGFMDAAQGKIKRLENVYLIQEDGHGQSTSRGQDHFTRLMSGSTFENLSAVCQTVSNMVAQTEKIDAEVFACRLYRAFLDFWAIPLSNHLYAHYDVTFSQMIRNLRTWLMHRLEKKYQTLGGWIRQFAQSIHEKKALKINKKYIQAHPNDQEIFQHVRLYLHDYTETACE